MNHREETFLNMALSYKREYKKCPWYKFKRRKELRENWLNALELMIKYSK